MGNKRRFSDLGFFFSKELKKDILFVSMKAPPNGFLATSVEGEFFFFKYFFLWLSYCFISLPFDTFRLVMLGLWC